MNNNKPYQSSLIPYEDEIVALRQKMPSASYARIAEYLREKYQITVSCKTILNFVKARSKGYDPDRTIVYMHEKPYQLSDEVYELIKMGPGSEKKVDNEYKRKGTCSIFICTKPLTGWRYVEAFERRTKVDWQFSTAWRSHKTLAALPCRIVVMY